MKSLANGKVPNFVASSLKHISSNHFYCDFAFYFSFFSFLPSLDNEDPVFSGCPTNINELLPASQLPVTVSWTAPTATDNTGNVSLDVNIESGSSFPEGTHEISYTANDDYGNSDVCVFSVIVTG